MYKIEAVDLFGNCLVKEHYFIKPTKKQLELFQVETLSKIDTFLKFNVSKVRYIDMGCIEEEKIEVL